jgi:intracellular septation protein A
MKAQKQNWRIVRSLLFVIIGLLNTVFIRPEDIGTWKNYLGYGFLLVAVIDMFFIIKLYLKRNKNEE